MAHCRVFRVFVTHTGDFMVRISGMTFGFRLADGNTRFPRGGETLNSEDD